MLKFNSCLGRSSDFLIKIRLCVYVITLCHLIVMSAVILGKDFSKSKDPHLQVYVKLKWKLITTWFNILLGPYLLMSIIYDWYDIKGEAGSRNITLINKYRNFFFSSILVPITMFGDIMFWRLYSKDKSLVMPLSAEEFVSIWNQHSMHTVSLLFVLFDLICVPRKRPKNMTAGITALIAFITLYSFVCFHSVINEEYIYPFMRTFSMSKFVMGFVYVLIENLFYYTGQWFIVDIIWGRRSENFKSLDIASQLR